MKQASLYFTGPRRIEIREHNLPAPAPGQVLVETLFTAISAGTELLLYRDLIPEDLPVDETIPSLTGAFSFPLKYGYAAVGRVIALGKDTPAEWEGRQVFSFHPHESHFLADPQELFPVPPDIPPEACLFLPTVETAINLLMDGQPGIGEQVVVFGQGVVGLVMTALLARYPLDRLVTLDRHGLRRDFSFQAGAEASLDPSAPGVIEALLRQLNSLEGREGADLVFEISGSPEALDDAIAVTGFGGRIVIGSWYGRKRVSVDLGGRFHRSRIRLISSQVSSIRPELIGRWTKSRRLAFAWSILKQIRPARYITHRFPFHRAAEAYALIDLCPEKCVQVILTY